MNPPSQSYGAASPCAPDFQLRRAGATTAAVQVVPIQPMKNLGKRAFPGFCQFSGSSMYIGCNRLMIRAIQ